MHDLYEWNIKLEGWIANILIVQRGTKIHKNYFSFTIVEADPSSMYVGGLIN